MVIVSGITTIVIVGTPTLENIGDANAIERSTNLLSDFGDQIEAVATGGKGTQTTVGLRFSRGEFVLDKDRDRIYYELETNARILSPRTTRQIGNLRISSMADAAVYNATYRGQPCWLLQNDILEVCIRKLPKDPAQLYDDTKTTAHWRFDENSGSTAADATDNDLDGDINGADWVPGLEGSALSVTTDDYVRVDDSTTLDDTIGGTGLTFSAWVNLSQADSYGETPVGIVSKRGSTSGASLEIQNAGSTTPDLAFRIGDGTSAHTAELSNDVAPENQWTHVAGTYNGTHLILYRNGAEVARSAVDTSIEANDADLFIGATDASNGHLNGVIDELRLYDTALTAEQVSWEAERRGLLDYIDTRDMVLYYHNIAEDKELNSDFGVTLHTSSGADQQGQPEAFTMNGTGHITPRLTGEFLGTAEVTAHVKSFYGIDYDVVFQLYSGADFLQVDVQP